MSNKKAADEKPRKARGLILKLLLGTTLVGAGGGGAYALVQTGVIPRGGHEEENAPRLILKGQDDPYAPPASKHKEGAELVYGDGGSKYRTAYYTFGDDFTSNLRDTDSLVQLSLAASTRYDGRVLMWLREHELAVRSRLLVEIANSGVEEVSSPQGKAQLQKRLTAAINEVLEAREGFGGIENVHFRSFIVQ